MKPIKPEPGYVYEHQYPFVRENTPRVVHCKREPYDVYIGRPSRWGNPFSLKSEADRANVIKQYREWLATQPELVEAAKRELRGKVLACWCAPRACHGDVLMEIANAGEPSPARGERGGEDA